MKLPQVIFVDAGLMFATDSHDVVEPCFLALIDMCVKAAIPLYLTGTGLECMRIPADIAERVCDVHRVKHATSALWYHLQKKHDAIARYMLYVSPHKLYRIAALNYGMTPVAVADDAVNRLGHSFETHLHTKQGCVYEDLPAFVQTLDVTLKAVADRATQKETLQYATH
ncbi:hypothetical protein A3C87_03660 [Candidatus Kaiserbacteria bacterium RIFCSPHIGHO2_02_FULL_49_34]|uniref:NYN domain-containing protein n=1 Tax=Candidatus Kaiserbacteria bacterium RIFCSPHIGHO2_02_FULL_49_34 TaxID=1798491 RepID=A0A1F6DIK4_9BACT|nr:MAG: hypothetical protein A3C87_03660 [Candidatus Kaiserbacteria bacterium RIFCSPHIGHO2_02_FULL_49_34]